MQNRARSRRVVGFLALSASCAALALASPAWAAPVIVTTDLGTLGGRATALGINASGEVVGASAGHVFVWTQAGGMIDITPLRGLSYPNAITDSGEVVGYSQQPDGSYHAFAWSEAGGYVDLDPGGSLSDAYAVNASGDVIGGRADPGGLEHAVLWKHDGGRIEIGTLGGISEPLAINASGQVAGQSQIGTDPNADEHAYSWTSAGGLVDLGTLGGTYASGRLVNDGGTIVGASTTADPNAGLHAFSWTASDGMRDLGTLGGYMSYPFALNASGQVAGYLYTSTFAQHAMVWTSAGGMVDLGKLEPQGATIAWAENDTGQVVGQNDDLGHAFSWSVPTGMVDLGSGQAMAVNASGQIVGAAGLDETSRATMWQIPVAAPVITSGATASTAMRTSFDLQVTTTASPIPSITESGPLPAGITFIDNRDGTADLAGLASSGTAGIYPLTIRADNGEGTAASQSFVLTVTSAKSAPALISDNAPIETFGVPFSVGVVATGYPLPKITKSGALPAGVTFVDNGDGTATLAGTPARAAVGVYTLTLTAKSAQGTATQTLTLAIQRSPILAKIRATKAAVGTPLSIAITSKGYSAPFIYLGGSGMLPDGLDLREPGDGTATIFGTPSAGTGGVYPIVVVAANEFGDASQTFTLTISEAAAFTSPDTASASIGQPFSFQATASGYPIPKLSRTGTLPKGITFQAATGTFSGTPKPGSAGTYPVSITAKNASGTTTQVVELTVS